MAELVSEKTAVLIAEHEARKLELLESIRTDISILWSTHVAILPWQLSWQSLSVKFLFWDAGLIVIYWADVRRCYQSMTAGRKDR